MAAAAITIRRATHSSTSSLGREGVSPTGMARIEWAFSRGANRTPPTPTPISAAMTA